MVISQWANRMTSHLKMQHNCQHTAETRQGQQFDIVICFQERGLFQIGYPSIHWFIIIFIDRPYYLMTIYCGIRVFLFQTHPTYERHIGASAYPIVPHYISAIVGTSLSPFLPLCHEVGKVGEAQLVKRPIFVGPSYFFFGKSVLMMEPLEVYIVL